MALDTLFKAPVLRHAEIALDAVVRYPAKAISWSMGKTASAGATAVKATYSGAKTAGAAARTSRAGQWVGGKVKDVGRAYKESAIRGGEYVWENKGKLAKGAYHDARRIAKGAYNMSMRAPRGMGLTTKKGIAKNYRRVFGDPALDEGEGIRGIAKWMFSGDTASRGLRTGGHPALLRMGMGAGIGGLGGAVVGDDWQDVMAGAAAGAFAMGPRTWANRAQFGVISGMGLAAHRSYQNDMRPKARDLNVSGDTALGMHNLRHGM